MIKHFSKLIRSATFQYSFASYNKPPPQKPVPPKVIAKPALKPVGPKPKKDQMTIQTAAMRLNIKEEALRGQLMNPKTMFVNQKQMRLLGIINGLNFQVSQELPMCKKSPVVTIMGHVDHGKTTLIDFLRSSSIAQGEVGGITQKVGAFHITCHGQKITFIDTPGHQAFSNMRQRGAFVTDMIVLIVSATQGVKKQTQEVIQLINKNELKAIVAINKIDLPNANVQQVQQQLFAAGVNIEPRGGNIPVVHISAKTGLNVSLLSQLILQQTKDLQACQAVQTEGIILQAYQNNRGFNAMTMIIKQGILKIGDIIIVGDQYTRVKHMHDDQGKSLEQANPGDAVQIIGIPNIPAAGDFIYQVQDEDKAKFITSKRRLLAANSKRQVQDRQTIKTAKLRLDYRSRKAMYNSATSQTWISKFKEKEEQIVAKIQQLRLLAAKDQLYAELLDEKEQQLKNHLQYVYQFLVNIGVSKDNFNVVLKFADRGIEETIHNQIQPIIARLKQKNSITVNILKSDIGQVTKTDVQQASTCQAQVLTFGCGIGHQAIQTASLLKIKPKTHNLIHNFLKDFEQSAILRKKQATIKGVEKGRGAIAQVFKLKAKRAGEEQPSVPGIRVTSGKISKSHKIYLFKNNTPVSEAIFIKFIKIFKKEVTEVKRGEECTITLEVPANFDFSHGDQLVAFQE